MVKVQKGKVTKEVTPNILSDYVRMGWKEVKEEIKQKDYGKVMENKD